jgi:imidazolonepropionase-like amidohydrolase
VKIAMGTDCGYPPCRHGTNAKELELLVDICGMSPMQAIVTSTKNCAETLHMEHKLGTLEPGKSADVLVVDGDPLKNIRLLQEKNNILMVMKGGAVCVDKLALC